MYMHLRDIKVWSLKMAANCEPVSEEYSKLNQAGIHSGVHTGISNEHRKR